MLKRNNTVLRYSKDRETLVRKPQPYLKKKDGGALNQGTNWLDQLARTQLDLLMRVKNC